MYYDDKLPSLRALFGTEKVALRGDSLVVDGRSYPILDDVIVLLAPEQLPAAVGERLLLRGTPAQGAAAPRHSGRVQRGFGEEWRRFGEILPEHEEEFARYFDLVDLSALGGARVMDLGCGMGRWSYFLRRRCRELVLVDFSEAIFVARRNLRDAPNALFFLGDLTRLPFRAGTSDLVVCLGVLHHLPSDALAAVRQISRYASKDLLVYLYYALDNRPWFYRALLAPVAAARGVLSRVESPAFRSVFSWAATLLLYLPLIALGRLLRPLGIEHHVPLAEAYAGKSLGRIRQDAYDRFFTAIEQRVSRQEILALGRELGEVVLSEGPPYWHFVLRRPR